MSSTRRSLASLPLLLWETPPGLELILAQEGVAFETVRDPHPLAFRAGRFVLYDGRDVPRMNELRRLLTPCHVPIDVNPLRQGAGRSVRGTDRYRDGAAPRGPSALGSSPSASHAVPKAWIRRRLIGRLRQAIQRAGGLWVRLAPFPFPYRSAFNFRADLDEPMAEDYPRFAERPGPWPTAALISSARTPTATSRPSCATCSATTPSRTGITITFTATASRTA